MAQLNEPWQEKLEAQLARLRSELEQIGSRTIPGPNGTAMRIDSISADQRQMWLLASRNDDISSFAQDLEARDAISAIVNALLRGDPLPESQEEASVEYCVADAQGAWAYWVDHAEYAPEDETLRTWHAHRTLRVARLTKDGSVHLSEGFTELFEPATSDARFARGHGNCCNTSYSQGDPRVDFNQDQTGDSVPELGMSASWSVEGTHRRSASVYRLDGDHVVSQRFDWESLEDVDHDGHLDLILGDASEVGEDCDAGFPISYSGKSYVAHALADGSYSLDDEVASAYTRQQCPAPPHAFANSADIWCGKVWGVAPAVIERGIKAACKPSLCSGPSNAGVCSWLEAMAASLTPKVHLQR